jgi:hypothetical protein
MTTEFSDFRDSCTKNEPSFVYYYRGNIVIESKQVSRRFLPSISNWQWTRIKLATRGASSRGTIDRLPGRRGERSDRATRRSLRLLRSAPGAICRPAKRSLESTVSRLHCPGSQVLGNHHLGLLTNAKASAINEHLAECPYCEAELEALKRFLIEPELLADDRAGHENCIR